MKLDYENILRIWRLNNNNESIPLSYTKIVDELTGLVTNISAQELLNVLRTENLIEINVLGEYNLTRWALEKRRCYPDQARVKVNINKGDEWINFRKILSYYIDCVHYSEKYKIYLYQNDLHKKYFVPNLPYNWLPELGKKSIFNITIPSNSQFAFHKLLANINNDEDIYIGYPISAFNTQNSTDIIYTPVGLIPINIIENTKTTLTLELRLEETLINQNWVEFYFPKEEQKLFINTIYNLHKDDKFSGMIDLLASLPLLDHKYDFDPNNLDVILPNKITSKKQLCNVPVIFQGDSLQYSKTLKQELKYIRDKVKDEELDTTSLAYIFRNPPLEATVSDKHFMPLEFIDCNQEQSLALESAINLPTTKITGPPGTGKSQVAVNIISNLIYNNKSVLFTSKNHKAVTAIAERSSAILGEHNLNLVNFCSNEDNSKQNAWHSQDIGILMANAQRLQTEANFDDAISKIDDSVMHWQEIEMHFRGRKEILLEYSKLNNKYKTLLSKLNQFIVNEDNNLYTTKNINLLKKHTSNLNLPVSFSLKHCLKYINWKLFGARKHKVALLYIENNYPYILKNAINYEVIKNRFNKFYDTFLEFLDIENKLLEVKKIADKLPSVETGTQNLKVCFDVFNKHLINALAQKQCEKINELSNNDEQINILKNIMVTLKNANDPYYFQKMRKKEIEEAEKKFKVFINYFPAWATTLLSLTKAAPCISNVFDCVIIDESSQCDIPAIIPALFRAKSVVLIGDPNQFPPVFNLNNVKNNLFKSKYNMIDFDDQKYDYLKNCAYDLLNNLPIFLREHFRCTKDIAEFCNKEFYANQLKIRSDEKPKKFPKCLGYKSAVEWINVQNSASNEMKEAIKLIKTLVDNKYEGSIGVITPFKNYKEQLQTELYNQITNKFNININTANGFQGGECDLIIFILGYNDTLTRGKIWYATAEENRYIYNVAVSRAKACLVIIGDKDRCAKSNVRVLESLSKLPLQKKIKTNVEFESPWEENFYYALLSEGIETLPQYPIMGRRLDLAIVRDNVKIDIEIDGLYFHTNSSGERNLDDHYRDLQINSVGWIVQRFWVHELKDNMSECINKIKDLLDNKR